MMETSKGLCGANYLRFELHPCIIQVIITLCISVHPSLSSLNIHMFTTDLHQRLNKSVYRCGEFLSSFQFRIWLKIYDVMYMKLIFMVF